MFNGGTDLGKSKKSLEREVLCRAEADEVKYMMLLNALNESGSEEKVDNFNLIEDEKSENP